MERANRKTLLIPIENFDNFKDAKDFSASEVTPQLLSAVKKLDEREELEPFLRSILADFGQTPHGPMEIADIFTHTPVVERQVSWGAKETHYLRHVRRFA